MEALSTNFRIYLLAIRPKTLIASISPVCIGSVIALNTHFDVLIFLSTLLFTLLIQIGTNLANDYFDFKQGADTKNRKGPLRVTQAKLISPIKIKQAFTLVFIAAFIVSLYPVYKVHIAFIFIALMSIFLGIFYTATSFSIAYLGLGEVFVFLFFGPICINGTYFLQTQTINPTSIISSIAPGLLSTAILIINNLRDIDEDRLSNKKTIAVRFGKTFVKSLYLVCISVSYALLLILVSFYNVSPYIFLCYLSLPLAIISCKRTLFETNLNLTLESTAKTLILYTLLFCLGFVL